MLELGDHQWNSEGLPLRDFPTLLERHLRSDCVKKTKEFWQIRDPPPLLERKGGKSLGIPLIEP